MAMALIAAGVAALGLLQASQDETPFDPGPAAGQRVPAFEAVDPEGTLECQVCSDTVSHLPASLPVEWKVTVRPLDRERVPEPLRRPDKK